MADLNYAGIRFPDRAEAIGEFGTYKVFLDPWQPLAEEMRRLWEPLADRSESSILAIYGQQGAGKTLFTKKVVQDFEAARLSPPAAVDENNIWHRISGSLQSRPSVDLIREATIKTSLTEIENNNSWVAEAASVLRGQSGRACVLLADNAERAYFRQGLVSMSDIEFLQHQGSDALTRLAAERLVEQMREELRGSMLVMLSNDLDYLTRLHAEVERQHGGLMRIRHLNLPDAGTKETVIRVNTNRLNPTTYWSIIDQGADGDRVALKQALETDKSFPDSFRAVDTASRNRTGRPAKRNVVTLITLVSAEEAATAGAKHLAPVKRTEVEREWLSVHLFEEGWAPADMDRREASLLESEWSLRVVTLGNTFVRSLLTATSDPTYSSQQAACRSLLDACKVFQGPGTSNAARGAFTSRLITIVDTWPASAADLTAFWGAGQPRATSYEGALRYLLPGYDSTREGFLSYRPDFVVQPFRPAAVTNATSDTNSAIRDAIRRKAHVFEFTALNEPSVIGLKSYLRTKLPNYVQLTQEQ